MSAPNDVELVRVFTREVGAAIADLTFPVDQDLEIVVEVEAGSTIFGGGTQFQTGVIVRDITANDNIPTSGLANPLGLEAMGPGAANWDTQADTFVYTVQAADLAGRENHVCEVVAFLRVRVADPDVTFATSPAFIIIP